MPETENLMVKNKGNLRGNRHKVSMFFLAHFPLPFLQRVHGALRMKNRHKLLLACDFYVMEVSNQVYVYIVSHAQKANNGV